MRATLATMLMLALAVPAGSDECRRRKPRLELRAGPRVAFSPVNVFVTARLVGGDELEEFYCPGLEWDWGDGARSVRESDCPPFELGTALQRTFTAEHAFRSPGSYTVRLALTRSGRTMAAASTTLTIQGFPGD